MSDLQLSVEISTIVIFILSCLLAYFLTTEYLKKRYASHLFWSIGLWLFAIGVAEEIAFAFGIYSEFLISAYLFIVVLIVEALALGSIQLIKSRMVKLAYYCFVIISSLLVLASLLTSTIGNILENYVVFGNLPLSVIVTSSLCTFAAAIVIVVIAAMSYMKKKNVKMLYIITGVIVVSIAGTLYIVSFPEFLYFSEFFGILLLWLGFFDFKRIKG